MSHSAHEKESKDADAENALLRSVETKGNTDKESDSSNSEQINEATEQGQQKTASLLMVSTQWMWSCVCCRAREEEEACVMFRIIIETLIQKKYFQYYFCVLLQN